jgi:hypothetical protein
MTRDKMMLSAIVILAALAGACGGSGGGSGGAGGDGNSTGTSTYLCCINSDKYRCPNKAAFDKCAGFDVNACMNACSPTDPTCMQKCNDQAATSTHDPSSCNSDPTVNCN